MTVGVSAAMPQNQQDALPLQTIAQATQPTTYSFEGGTVSKYWDAATLGINGAGVSLYPITAGNVYYLATPFLDMRGCNWFTLMLERFATTDNATSPLQLPFAFTLYAQYRTGPADTPSIVTEVSAGSVSPNLSGYVGVGPYAGLANFGASANGVRQREAITFGTTFAAVGGNQPQLALGTDTRLIVYWSTNNPLPAHDTSTFSAWLWGSS